MSQVPLAETVVLAETLRAKPVYPALAHVVLRAERDHVFIIGPPAATSSLARVVEHSRRRAQSHAQTHQAPDRGDATQVPV